MLVMLILASATLSGCIQPKTTMVPMRDGTKLATDAYVTTGQQPHGSILIWWNRIWSSAGPGPGA